MTGIELVGAILGCLFFTGLVFVGVVAMDWYIREELGRR